jgi:hypothetical protein
MSVDLRTRTDGDVPTVDAERFFEIDLPELVDARPDLVESARDLDLRPLALEVDGRSWVLDRNGTVTARPGTADATLALTAERFADLVTDQITPVGLMIAGELTMDRNLRAYMDWWLVLRSLLDERPVHRAGDSDLEVDPTRSFTLDDDPDEIHAFLEAAGFLHLRGVYTDQEMQQVYDDMDRFEPEYRQGDGQSWWATLSDGSERVVRMQAFEHRSDATQALVDDDRYLAIGGLARSGHEAVREARKGRRVEALFKPLGVAQGISDVPWHKDCSVGRHSYECCSLTVGISVTGAGPTSGQLRVVAGSHRALVWPSLLDPSNLGLPDVPLATETGDVTVHLSCTLHMAQPPVEQERRVLYTGFGLPAPDAEAALAARRRIQATREQAPVNMTQPPAG